MIGAEPGRGRSTTGLGDKARHAAEKGKGKAEETVGKATSDEDLEAEGKTEQTKASLKQAGDDVKDAFGK